LRLVVIFFFSFVLALSFRLSVAALSFSTRRLFRPRFNRALSLLPAAWRLR
jgi:hypothetical protein